MRRLYHQPLSPFCRKVRLVLAEKGIEVTLIEEKTWERRHEFLMLNPAAAVPVFVDRDAATIADSQAIIEYFEETFPSPPLMPKNPSDRAEVRRLIAWFDDKFHREVTVNLLYERVHKKLSGKGYPDSAAVRAGASNIKHHLDYIDWLIEERNWLAGDDLSLADFAAAAHLSCLDFIGCVPWDHSEITKNWYARIKSRPAFRPLLSDTVTGFQPPAHYSDLDF